MALTQTHRPIAVSTPLDEDVLVITRMTGHEALGHLFEYQLELLSEDHEIKLDDMLGGNVTVRLDISDDMTRYFNGYISHFLYLGSQGRYATYRVILNPWLWFLTRTADCRIFQEMSVPDIVKQVFRDHGFTDFDDTLSDTYRTREYCVQYRETDFDFVSRLLEHEGIYYYFRHENGRHVLVLADGIGSHDTVSGYETVPFQIATADRREPRERIYAWTLAGKMQPAAFALNDFDFKAPRKDLRTQLSVAGHQAPADLEVYNYPGYYTESSDGDRYVRIRMEEKEARYETVHGEGDAKGLTTGALFDLSEYPRTDQNRKYLIVSADYELQSDAYQTTAGASIRQEYQCRFTALDSQHTYRPPRTTPKPVVQGPQTAIVVGPKGHEIHTDEWGRVKVHFHWNRYDKADESSSCWIRVGQIWTGKQWGSMHIPRIGQEVIVDFLEGDPDRPIITGHMYNDVNPPPYELPSFATVTTVKSNSSKGGGGFNEIRMEDKKGEEQLFVHAEKNFDLRVKNDRFETIGQDRNTVVENDKKEHVKNDRHEKVDNHHNEKIGGDRNLKVVGKQAMAVEKSLSLTVNDDVIEVFKANHSEQVTSDYYLKGTNLVIEGTTNITLKVGQSYIAIEAGGIKIGSTGQIVLEATNSVSVKGTAGVKIESPAQVEVQGTQTSVKGSAMTEIQGAIVKIN